MAVCVKCGFDLVGDQSECPRCGVLIVKAQPARTRPIVTEAPTTITINEAPHAATVTGLRGDATKLRFFATGIDSVVATIACLIVAAKLTEVPAEYSEYAAIGRWIVAALIYLTYYFVQEWIWGTTLGKRVFGLQIARLDGGPVGLWEAGWRTLLRIFEANPLLFGAIPGALAVVWSRRRQRLGDMMAGTIVVSRKALASEQAQIKAARGG